MTVLPEQRVGKSGPETRSAGPRKRASIRAIYVCVYTIESYMRFTWNPEKARRNLRIHGVSSETAAEIFHDPNHVVTENYFIEEEGGQRYQAIGASRGLVLLLVVFVDRSHPTEEIIHIFRPERQPLM